MANRSSQSRKPGSLSSSSSPSRKKFLRSPTEEAEAKAAAAEEDMEDDEEFAAIRSSKRRKTASQKKKKNCQKLSRKPKKPPTAFFYFLEDFRKVYQEQNPQIKSMREIGKAGGEKWKTMTYEEKVQYYDTAANKRAEFDIAMEEYNKKQETGGGQEHDDE